MAKPSSTKAVLTIACSSSLLLAGYECVRSASNSLFKQAYGMAHFPLMMALTPLFVFFCLYAYNKLLDRFSDERTLFISTLISISALLGCYVLIRCGFDFGTILLYFIRETYIVLLIEQFWSYINSVLKQQQAKKLNGMILAISSLGSTLCGVLVSQTAEYFGTINMVAIAALISLPALALNKKAHHFCSIKTQQTKNSEKKSDSLGLSLFSEHKVLLLILFVILASQFYSAFIGLHFQDILHNEIPNIDQQTAFSGRFFALVNGSSLLIHLFVSPIILTRLSPLKIHALIPLCHIVLLVFILIKPSLWSAAFALFMFKSLDYSLFRAAKEILYIPLPYDARFRAKELIDVLGYRLGKGCGSLLVSVTSSSLFFGPINLVALSLLTVTSWFMVVLPLKGKHSSEQNKQII